MVENDILDKVLLWIAIALESRDADTADAAAMTSSMASRKLDIDSAKRALTNAVEKAEEDAVELLCRLEMCFTFSNAGDRSLLRQTMRKHDIYATPGKLIEYAKLLSDTPSKDPKKTEWKVFRTQYEPDTQMASRPLAVLTDGSADAPGPSDSLFDSVLEALCDRCGMPASGQDSASPSDATSQGNRGNVLTAYLRSSSATYGSSGTNITTNLGFLAGVVAPAPAPGQATIINAFICPNCTVNIGTGANNQQVPQDSQDRNDDRLRPVNVDEN